MSVGVRVSVRVWVRVRGRGRGRVRVRVRISSARTMLHSAVEETSAPLPSKIGPADGFPLSDDGGGVVGGDFPPHACQLCFLLINLRKANAPIDWMGFHLVSSTVSSSTGWLFCMCVMNKTRN